MLLAALRDLQWRHRRFVIAIFGTGMVFAMTLVLTGLSHGFFVEAQRTVDSLGIDNYVIKEGAVGPFLGSSTFPATAAGEVAKTRGVEQAIPVVYASAILTGVGAPQNLNVFGLPESGLGMPAVISGRKPSDATEIAVSDTLGKRVGDNLSVGSQSLRIVGLVHDSTALSGQSNAFLTLLGAQQLLFAGQPLISAVGVRGTPEKIADGYRLIGRDDAISDMERPLTGAKLAISYLADLLWVVAALIVGSLIYLSALERTRDFAVFKAVGVSTGAVLAGLALQAIVVAVLAAAIGAALSVVLGPMFPMLCAVPASAFVLLPLLAVGIGLLASAAGLRRVVRVDPALAFGGP